MNSSAALIHWFNNNNDLPDQPAMYTTTGVTMLLSLPPNKSTPPLLRTNLTNPENLIESWSQGSFLHLPNGNYFMGYGDAPIMTEYGPLEGDSTNSEVLWTARFSGDGVDSYRAYKQAWHATPETKPDLVVLPAVSSYDALASCSQGASHRGYVSWNGATDVTSWVVYAGSSNSSLKAVGRAYKMGFETEFPIPQGAKFAQVGAVENNGSSVVRVSEVVKVGD